MLALELGLLDEVFFAGDGELGPLMEYGAGAGAGPALQFRFDGPG